MSRHPVSAYPAIPPGSLSTTLLYTVRLLSRRIRTSGVNITMIPAKIREQKKYSSEFDVETDQFAGLIMPASR